MASWMSARSQWVFVCLACATHYLSPVASWCVPAGLAPAAIRTAGAFTSFHREMQTPRVYSRVKCAAKGLRMNSDGVMPKKKVLVTGIGAVSPIGVGTASFFENLFAGKSGISKLPSWADEFPSNIGGQIKEFKAEEWYANKKEAKRQSRYMHLGIAASKLALNDAKLDSTSIETRNRFGILIATAIGGSEFYEEASEKWSKHSEYDKLPAGAKWGDAVFEDRNSVYKGPEFMSGSKFTFEGFKKISPFIVPAFIMNSGSGVAAVELNAQGPNYCIGGYGGEGTAGSLSIGQAYRFLSTGESDVIIAGGSESCLTPCVLAGLNQMSKCVTGANDAPAHASRPFDKSHSGYVIGEGSGVLVLESEDHALGRGAPVYCEMAGFGSSYGLSLDPELGLGRHPDSEAVARAITIALKNAGVKPEEVGYVSAHGTGVPEEDRVETAALKSVFGDHARRLKISSIKPQIGNTLAAAGGFEAGVCAYAIREGRIPGTANLKEPDTEGGCDLDYTPGGAASVPGLSVAVSINLGLGGQASCLVFKRYTPSA